MRSLLAAGLAAVSLALLWRTAEPSVHFVAEDVRLEVAPHRAKIIGRYIFANPTPRFASQTVFYPIPRDEGLLAVDTCKVEHDGTPVHVERDGDRFLFSIEIPPHSKTELTVEYVQPLAQTHARYALWTTWLWGRALPESRLSVIAAPELGPITINYPLRETSPGHHTLLARPLAPAEDLEVRWSP